MWVGQPGDLELETDSNRWFDPLSNAGPGAVGVDKYKWFNKKTSKHNPVKDYACLFIG